jgi:nicotinate-nucleotide pyrophosphorylase (carboxylating)
MTGKGEDGRPEGKPEGRPERAFDAGHGGPGREDVIETPPFLPPAAELQRVARQALEEDAAHEDVTSRAIVPTDAQAHALATAKQEGVVCGLPAVLAVLRETSNRIAFTRLVKEGTEVRAGTGVCAMGGPAREILAAERSAMNLLGRLSGIATLARRFVRAVEGTGVTVHHTRKTTPGLRALEVYAARVGGAGPHRLGLHEAVLAKENHFRAAGRPFGEALKAARRQVPPGTLFGTEVETLGELCLALEAGVDLILLDDFPLDQVRRAVEERNARGVGRRPLLEVSGGVTLENVRSFAETGVERVSAGALTHSAPWLDVSLKIVPGPRP